MLLRAELWTALYLLAGVGTYLFYKKLVVETSTDPLAHGLTGLMVIFFWPLILVFDLCGWLWYHAVKHPLIHLRYRRDGRWLAEHRKHHGEIGIWWVEKDGVKSCFWTCSCDSEKRYYPRGVYDLVEEEWSSK